MEFTLRPWENSDLSSLVKYANNPRIARNLTNQFPHPYTEEAGKAFISYARSDDPIHIFAIAIQGEAVGGIGLHPQTDIFIKNMELGYWLAEPFWGKGIITRAIAQMLRFGFTQYAIDRIFARPFGTNIASQKALEKNKFILEATFHNTIYKHGEYLDELVYAIRRHDWEK